MAQDGGAAGPDERGPGATISNVPGHPDASHQSPPAQSPESPEMWGNNGLIGEGRYRLTARIGRGGMAEVFAAEDVRLGRPVAVKLLRADLAEDPVSKARFTREAQSVAGLNHHAVVAVYDSGEEYLTTSSGRASVVPYMVMELIHGQTIRELLVNTESPTVDQALSIVSGVLEALAYSHQHGIVHRDIKPANVIITDTGSVKVMDFGIARALHGAAQTMTQTGMVMGTPQYLSPEQALGKSIDARSDLYAVGCLLYELLALRPPFTGETPLSVVYQHVQDTPRLPSEVSSAAPPELDGLVMRSLAKEPDDRFQSAEAMRAHVEYALGLLREHGGHTGGLWNTGPTSVSSTPPMGTPSAATTALRRSDTPPTGQLTSPMLLGDPGDDTGATRHGGRRGGSGRMALVALLALAAIGIGVLVAWSLGGGSDSDDPETTETGQSTDESGDGSTETGGDQQSQDTGEDDEGSDETSDYYPSYSYSEEETSPSTSYESSTSPSESETTEPTPSETTEPSATEEEPEPSASSTTPSSTPSETGDDEEEGPGGLTG